MKVEITLGARVHGVEEESEGMWEEHSWGLL